MKKTYETPSIEVVAFQYRDQVVAASGTQIKCTVTWYNKENSSCEYGGIVGNEL